MQAAHQSLPQVVQAAPIVVQLSIVMPIKAERQRIDGEVSAVQIEFDAAAVDGWQGGGMGVKLRAS